MLPLSAIVNATVTNMAANSTAANLFGGLLASGMIGIPILYLGFMCVMSLLGIAATILWIYVLIDIIQRTDDKFPDKNSSNNKLIWLLVVIFLHWIGAAIYYFVVMKPMGPGHKQNPVK